MPTNALGAYTIICAFAPALAAAVTAPYVGPNGDAMAALGATLATALAVLEARAKTPQQIGSLLSVAISSFWLGLVAPGFLAAWWLPDSLVDRVTWHGWALAGFICGLLGWSIVRVFQVVGPSIVDAMMPGALKEFIARKLGVKLPSKDD